MKAPFAVLLSHLALLSWPSMLSPTPKSADDQKPLDASAILKRMAKAYESCQSYRDSGTVTTLFPKLGIDDQPTYTTTKTFHTAFIRPNKFRFEYTEKEAMTGLHDHYVIWSSGGKVYSWWTIRPNVTEASSLSMAVAGATGVSSGSAHTVPRLLMPTKVGGWGLTELAHVKLISEEKLGKEPCVKVEGSYSSGDVVRIWISKRTNMIHRIVELGHQLRTTETTVYNPELNARIPDKTFAFTPPKRK